MIDYDHDRNLHTLEGASAAFRAIFADSLPKSILDVGCGQGTWLRAALDLGVSDVLGLDGVNIPEDHLFIPAHLFRQQDLTQPWNLERRFEVAICVEVAEHLDKSAAEDLIGSITRHTDVVVFSASPFEGGQHHVNCQWPAYWQRLFNNCGFACHDDLRWRIWDDARIEAWYRQDVFLAKRDPNAGTEERIKPVVHPEMLQRMLGAETERCRDVVRAEIERGSQSVAWYLGLPAAALLAKMKRSLSRALSARTTRG
jgi:SAM-dependent methyltransferase